MSRSDDFEKRLQYIFEEEEAAVLSRMKRPSQSWLRMARHLILSSFLFKIVAVGYAVLTTTGSVDLDRKMRALQVLPMFLSAPSFASYSSLVSFTGMCQFRQPKCFKSFR
ncbi:hypothetical protein NL676_012146 [Syzygium grande]|nr:hypothetical protein NL676_012146 [Syzygium grande]